VAQSELTRAAQKIIDSMRVLAAPKQTFRSVDENEFPALLETYRTVRSHLEGKAFRYLGDLEIVEVSLNAGSLMQRTYIRSLTSPDSTIVVGFFKKSARRGRLARLLITGILNFRWIAAPRFFLKQVVPRNIFDVETEFSDGSFLVTSNAESAANLTWPRSIETEFHPVSTSIDFLLARHAQRLAARRVVSAAIPLKVTSVGDVVETQHRQQMQKAAFRQTLNLVSKGELEAMGLHSTQSDALFDEVRRLLREQA
jgi:hypothetical protein